jgi:hypothetical protein
MAAVAGVSGNPTTQSGNQHELLHARRPTTMQQPIGERDMPYRTIDPSEEELFYMESRRAYSSICDAMLDTFSGDEYKAPHAVSCVLAFLTISLFEDNKSDQPCIAEFINSYLQRAPTPIPWRVMPYDPTEDTKRLEKMN